MKSSMDFYFIQVDFRMPLLFTFIKTPRPDISDVLAAYLMISFSVGCVAPRLIKGNYDDSKVITT